MQLTIESLNHQGLGIAHENGKTIFVKGALPGEVVMAERIEQHRRYDVAKTLEILTVSEARVSPACPHFQVCGGCALQHMQQDAQLALKQQVLLEQLQHFAKAKPKTILTPISDEPYGYRHKARIGVKFVIKKDKLLVGFREHNNRYLADLDTCPVLIPSVGASFAPLRDVLMRLSNYQHIAQIELAAGDDVVALVIRHLTPFNAQDEQILKEYGEKTNQHIYLQPKGPETVHCIWPQESENQLSYTLNINDETLTLNFHPMDFTQVNKNANQLMVNRVLSLLELNNTDTVLDLFSGLGNFTLPIAKTAATVVGVEGSQEMVKRLLTNAKANSLNNVSAYMADLTKPIDHLPWAKLTYDKLVLDPPRAGALEIAQQIKKFGAEKIVYISCHLATLARDTQVILEQGYQLEKAGIIDMFPHTMHVESVALFNKKR